MKGGAMLCHSIKYEYKDITPSYEEKNFIETLAENLHMSSPSDSAMKVVVQENGDYRRVSCQIVSFSQRFEADAISDCPKRAMQEVERQLMPQIDKWKELRFNKELNEKQKYFEVAV